MSFSFCRSSVLILACVLPPMLSIGGDYGLKAGEFVQGEISGIMGKNVTIAGLDGELGAYEIADFDEATQAAIRDWGKRHPESANVFSRWDTQPIVKSSSQPVLPRQFLDNSFRGMVSVDMILDEAGRVIDAKVWKSTHPELESPKVKAAKSWRFEPAKIDGKPVKVKLRIPFKFSRGG